MSNRKVSGAGSTPVPYCHASRVQRSIGQHGMTLVEVLVALSVFAIVLSIAYSAIVSSLQVQADQEAVTTTQARLRRIVEVVSQDLRSAVFGSIIDTPYESTNTQVSFMLLTGGAGYAVLPDPAGNQSFMSGTSIEITGASAAHFKDNQVVMVNADGTGVLLQITSVTAGSRSGSWKLNHPACRNTIAHTSSTLLFEVETLGLRLDEDSSSIRTHSSTTGTEAAFAFDVSGLRFDYLYTSPAASGEPLIKTEPYRVNGRPVRNFVDDGHIYSLARLQIVAESQAVSRGRSKPSAYSAQVDLSDNEFFTLRELVTCGS